MLKTNRNETKPPKTTLNKPHLRVLQHSFARFMSSAEVMGMAF